MKNLGPQHWGHAEHQDPQTLLGTEPLPLHHPYSGIHGRPLHPLDQMRRCHLQPPAAMLPGIVVSKLQQLNRISWPS